MTKTVAKLLFEEPSNNENHVKLMYLERIVHLKAINLFNKKIKLKWEKTWKKFWFLKLHNETLNVFSKTT